eukprot:gene1299-749_t
MSQRSPSSPPRSPFGQGMSSTSAEDPRGVPFTAATSPTGMRAMHFDPIGEVTPPQTHYNLHDIVPSLNISLDTEEAARSHSLSQGTPSPYMENTAPLNIHVSAERDQPRERGANSSGSGCASDPFNSTLCRDETAVPSGSGVVQADTSAWMRAKSPPLHRNSSSSTVCPLDTAQLGAGAQDDVRCSGTGKGKEKGDGTAESVLASSPSSSTSSPPRHLRPRGSSSGSSIKCVPLPLPVTPSQQATTLNIAPTVLARRNAIWALAEDPEDHLQSLDTIQKSVDEREHLRELLLQNPLFCNLDPEAIDSAVDVMVPEEYSKGELVFEQGKEPHPKLFVVLYGECEVYRNGKHLRSIPPGGYFGELELMYQQKSSVATVECRTDTTFYTLHRDHYQRIMLWKCLDQRNRFKQFIDSVPFLKNVSEYDRLRLADAMSVRHYSSGDLIMSYGQPCVELFFLMEGLTRVMGRNEEGHPMEIVCQEPGAVIGELEFLFGNNAVADVTVVSQEAKVARISRQHFENIMGPIASCLMEFIAEVPLYESYLEKHANRKVHQEIQQLRDKAKRLKEIKDSSRARKSRTKTRSREKSPPLSYVYGDDYASMPPPHSAESLTAPPGLRRIARLSPAPAGGGGGGAYSGTFEMMSKMEEFVTHLSLDGELVVPLPQRLVCCADVGTPVLQREMSRQLTADSPVYPNNVFVSSDSRPWSSLPSAGVTDYLVGAGTSSTGGGTARDRDVCSNARPFLHYPIKEIMGLTDLIIVPVREDGMVLGWNDKMAALTGYRSGDAVGQSVYALLQSEHEQQLLQETIRRTLEDQALPHMNVTADSTLRDPQGMSTTTPGTSVTPQRSPRAMKDAAWGATLFHLSREDGFSSATVELQVMLPSVEYLLMDTTDWVTYRVVLLIAREKKLSETSSISKLISAGQLMQQARETLANGEMSYEDRLFAIAEIIENYDAIRRAQEVSKADWQPVHLRELIGKVVMDSIGESIDKNHTIHQRFDNLTMEEASNADITVTVSMREHASMEFLAFVFSCDNAHISPPVNQLLKEIEARNKRHASPSPSPQLGGVSQAPMGSSGHMPFTGSDYVFGESFMEQTMGLHGMAPDSSTQFNASPSGLHSMDPALTEVFNPRFRKHVRGIRHAIEEMGGTIRTHRDEQQSHMMFLLPFIPVAQATYSPPPDLEDSRTMMREAESTPNMMESTSLVHGAAPKESQVQRSRSDATPISFFSPQAVSPSIGPHTPGSTAMPPDLNATGRDDSAVADPPWALYRANKTEYSQQQDMLAATGTTAITGSPTNMCSSGLPILTSPFQQNRLEEAISQALSFTTLVAEENTAQRNLLCKYLWQRKHAVLSATTFAEVERLAETVDIIIIDVFQYMLQSSNTLNFLQEKAHRLSVIVTGEMDQASRDAYQGTGFLVVPKPVRPSEFRAAMARAEEKIRAFKKDAHSIAMIRHALSGFRMSAWTKGELLGRGTHGEVYKATSTLTGGVMAVKEMRVGRDSEKLEEILTEISTMCSLQHPNIIHYFSCELSSEAAMISNPIPAQGAGQLRTAAEGGEAPPLGSVKGKSKLLMASVHNSGRDSPPAPVNRYLRVFMEYASGGALRDHLSSSGKLEFKEFQSLLYNIDGRRIGYSFPSDIWSLGVVAMEMITNAPPYAHIKAITGPAALTQYLTTLTSDTPDLSPLFAYPPCVTEFIAACLQVSPDQRATAEDLLHFSIFHETTDLETLSALKALRQAELRHVLAQYVAFQDPKEEGGSPKMSAGGGLGAQNPAESGSDDFFDSDTTEEESEEEDKEEDRYAEEADRVLLSGKGSHQGGLPPGNRGLSSYPSTISDGPSPGLGQANSGDVRLTPQCLPLSAPPKEYDMHSTVNTPLAPSPSALPNASRPSSNEYPPGTQDSTTVSGMVRSGAPTSSVEQAMAPPIQPSQARLLVGDGDGRKDAAPPPQRHGVYRDTSGTLRTSTSFRESFGHGKASLTQFRARMRPTKLSAILRTASSAMEEAADDLMSSFYKAPDASPAFPSATRRRPSILLHQSSFHPRTSSTPATDKGPEKAPSSPGLPRHPLTMANLTTLRRSPNGSDAGPNPHSPLTTGERAGTAQQLPTSSPSARPPSSPGGPTPTAGLQQQQRPAFNFTRMARCQSISSVPGGAGHHLFDETAAAAAAGAGGKDGIPVLQLPRTGVSGGGGGVGAGGVMNTSSLSPAGSNVHPSRSLAGGVGQAPSVHSPLLLTPCTTHNGSSSVLERSAAHLFRMHHRLLRKRVKTETVFVAPQPASTTGQRGLDDVSSSPTPLTSFVELAGGRGEGGGEGEGGDLRLAGAVASIQQAARRPTPQGPAATHGPARAGEAYDRDSDADDSPPTGTTNAGSGEEEAEAEAEAEAVSPESLHSSPTMKSPHLEVLVEDIQHMLNRIRSELPFSGTAPLHPGGGPHATPAPAPAGPARAARPAARGRRAFVIRLESDVVRRGRKAHLCHLERLRRQSVGCRFESERERDRRGTAASTAALPHAASSRRRLAMVKALKEFRSVLRGVLAAGRKSENIDSPSNAPNNLPKFSAANGKDKENNNNINNNSRRKINKYRDRQTRCVVWGKERGIAPNQLVNVPPCVHGHMGCAALTTRSLLFGKFCLPPSAPDRGGS